MSVLVNYHMDTLSGIGYRSEHIHALLDGSNVRLNWNIESDMNVNWIKSKNFLSLY